MKVTKKAIAEIISPLVEIEIREADYQSSLQSEFNMDSIVLVEAIIALETVFGIEFKDTDLVIENFENINAIYNNIVKYRCEG